MHNVSCIAKIWLTLMAMLFRQAKQKSHLGNEPHFINFTLHASSSCLSGVRSSDAEKKSAAAAAA